MYARTCVCILLYILVVFSGNVGKTGPGVADGGRGRETEQSLSLPQKSPPIHHEPHGIQPYVKHGGWKERAQQ